MSSKTLLPPSGGRENILTAEALVDLEVPQDLSLSPDGHFVAYTLQPATRKGSHEVSSLWVAQVGHKNSAKQLTSGGAKDECPKWSPKGDVIAFISDRAKHGKSSAIYTVAMDTEASDEQDPIAVTKPQNRKHISSLTWSADGSSIAFLSADESKDDDDPKIYQSKWEYNRLRCVNVVSRTVTTLFEEPKHVHKFAWNSESSDIGFVLHDTPDPNSASYHGAQFARLSRRTKKVTYMAKFPGLVVEIIWFANTFHFLAGNTPESSYKPTIIWSCSAEDGEQMERVQCGEEDTASDLRWTSTSPAAHIKKGLTDEICLLSEHLTLYSGSSGIESWDVLSTKGKSPVLVIGLSTSRSPTEVYSVSGEELTQLSIHSRYIDDLDLVEAQPFLADAKDGTPLEGVLYPPFPTREKPWATVVVVHGGPYDRDNLNFYVPGGLAWAPWLANAGYAVLSPNYRGSSGRGHEFANVTMGAMGTKDYDDIISMVTAGIERGMFDKDRIAIGGWSQGGFLSYLAVTRPDFHFRAAVAGAGVTDWDMLTMSSDLPSMEAELAGPAPWTSDEKFTQTRNGSAIWHMDNISTPILILHGEKDERIPLSQAIAFYRGCMHHKIDCEMVVYPREPHVLAERQHNIDMLKRIKDFYDKHMNH